MPDSLKHGNFSIRSNVPDKKKKSKLFWHNTGVFWFFWCCLFLDSPECDSSKLQWLSLLGIKKCYRSYKHKKMWVWNWHPLLQDYSALQKQADTRSSVVSLFSNRQSHLCEHEPFWPGGGSDSTGLFSAHPVHLSHFDCETAQLDAQGPGCCCHQEDNEHWSASLRNIRTREQI